MMSHGLLHGTHERALVDYTIVTTTTRAFLTVGLVRFVVPIPLLHRFEDRIYIQRFMVINTDTMKR